VCAAIPVIKVLRESLVATNVHRVLGIVNGTTNFILSQMEQGDEYADALEEAQRLGFAEADPTEDVNGAGNSLADLRAARAVGSHLRSSLVGLPIFRAQIPLIG
jgi:homoserine dehydrogenase